MPEQNNVIPAGVPEDAGQREKRLWCYVQPPAAYEIAPHDCGHDDAQWSEFDKHLWCSHCAVDFLPAHAGIFSGPIGIELAAMMGICFDRVTIATGKIDRFDTKTGRYASEPITDDDGIRKLPA